MTTQHSAPRFPHALRHLESAVAAAQAGDHTALSTFLERFAGYIIENAYDNPDYHTIEYVEDMPVHLYQRGQKVESLEQAIDMLKYGRLEAGRWWIVKAVDDCYRTYVLMESNAPVDAGEDTLEKLAQRLGLDLERGWTWSDQR